MKIIRYILLTTQLFVAGMMGAQDAEFTQFYAAPTYLNPAFAGTSVQSRLSTNYRNQWPSIPGAFVSYNAAYDQYIPEINSGIGFMATHEKAGSGALKSTNLSAIYSYEVRIKRDLFFRPAMQFSYGNRSINFADLTFGDQLLREDAPTSLEQSIIKPVNYFDFSAGMLLMSSKAWLGLSLHHINEPNESLYGNEYAHLPRKFSAHGGLRLKMSDPRKRVSNYVVPAFNYRRQGNFDQLDFGLYYEFNPVVVGIWYRGIPIQSNQSDALNHDAIAFTFGYESGRYKFAYSYDITISNLSVASTSGAHELSLTYEWANRRNRKLAKRRVVPCAKF